MSRKLTRTTLVFSIVQLLFLISSCSDTPEIHYRYSNGEEIRDSLSVKLLHRQLKLKFPELDTTQSLDVKTFLDWDLKGELDGLIQQTGEHRIPTMLVMDNETGKIVYSKNSRELAADTRRIGNTKLFGMLLSFEEGVKLSDTFSWVGKQSKREYARNIASLYRITPPSTDYTYPFDEYSCLQWAKFMDRIAVRYDDSVCFAGYPRFFSVSLMDLVKTCSLIQRNGSVTGIHLLDVVTDEEGMESRLGIPSGFVLRPESCISVKKVLQPVRASKSIEFCYRFSVGMGRETRRGIIMVTQTHTIGFLSDSDSLGAPVFKNAFLEQLGQAVIRK
ncbi:hypothetical protein [Fluviicola sp.]|uniref:hypothetical protein n=1 Tax=Fluviicola sp. TaxID=1917219 RepID=UPI0031DD994C